MKITWFGHSAFRVETGASVVLFDPFLSGNPTWNGTVEDAAHGTTHVVLTHGHDDHLGDAEEICKSTGATLVANAEIASYLGSKGVADVSPGNHGGRIHFDGFTIAFVQAWHSSSSTVGQTRVYLGNPAGIILIPESDKVLYHMGDTDIFSDMGLINEIYQPKVGIVPIGDRFTMGADLAARACKSYFRFDTIIPCHYGTFPIIDQTADKFVAEMAGHNVAVMEPGRTIEV